MKLNPPLAIVLTGLSWLCIGLFLLWKGVIYIASQVLIDGSSPLMSLMDSGEKGALFIVAIGLFLGFIKGRFILSKTVGRLTRRFVNLGSRLSWKNFYPLAYVVLIALMMSLGISLRFIPIPLDVKGLIDIAVGSALVNGAMLFFRQASALHRQREK